MKKIRVDDLGKIVTGKTPRTNIPENYGGNVPFLTPTDDLSPMKCRTTLNTISELGLKEVKNCIIPKDSICVSCIGSDMGHAIMTSKPTVTNQQFNSIIPSKDYHPEYVYYLMVLLGRMMKSKFGKSSTAVPIVSKSLFSSFEIYIEDDKRKQKEISDVLANIDEKIALNTRMNAELEAMAKQLYDYWFVQFDFPDENGNPYKSSGGKMVYNSTLKREIPAGWEVKEISDITEIKSGYPFKSENMNEYKGKYKIVTIRNVQENNLDLSNISYTDIIPDNIKSYCILKEKDILISLTGNVGRTCLVYENGLLLNQRVGLVQPKNSNVPWCYSIFKDKSIRTAVENWANGCAQANVSPLDIERLKIPVPSNDILQYFDKSVKPMIERQIKIAKQNNYLTHLRDSLLPMLMNGQVTVE